MKLLSYLFTLFFAFNALAVAPYGIKGQQQAATLYSNVHQFPNNQVTNLGGINALVETGNKNILLNPSFEAALVGGVIPSWNFGSLLPGINLSNVIDGKNSAFFAAAGDIINLTQSSTLYAGSFADGVQGLAMVRIKSDIALKVCSIQAGTVSTTNCVTTATDSKWKLYKIPFVMGPTSQGISISSNGTLATGTVYVDDAFVGAVDLQASVDASKIAGESYFAGTASCLWPRTSTTLGAFTSTAACPGPTVNYSSMGQWQTTDSDLPRQTINNLPAGVYKATFIAPIFSSAASSSTVTINDGTSNCVSLMTNSSNSSGLGIISCVFTYASSGNRIFELYGASATSTINIENNVATLRNTKFTLEYFGSSSVYTSNNADTDWASCGHTAASFTGFGTVTAIETQCKRQGSDLLMRGKVTTGTVTAVEARLALPIWQGSQLVSAGSSIIPSLQIAGDSADAVNGTTYFRSNTLIEPSVSYVTFGLQTSIQNAITKANGNNLLANSAMFSFTARIPINGWNQSNIIIGSFSGLQTCTDTLACTDTFSAFISSSGTVSNENVDFISGNCTPSGTLNYINTCTINSSLGLTLGLNCAATGSTAWASAFSPSSHSIPTSTASQLVIESAQSSDGARTAYGKWIICQKQGADYIGKTAMAVASDQNVRSIGSTNVDIQSVLFGTGANCNAACTTGTCSLCSQSGSKITSVTWNATGSYNVNGLDGTKYLCTGGGEGTSYVNAYTRKDSSTSSLVRVQTGIGVTLTNSAATIICIGIP